MKNISSISYHLNVALFLPILYNNIHKRFIEFNLWYSCVSEPLWSKNSRTPRPGNSLLSAIDKKSSLWARIPNLRRVLLPLPSPVLANMNSIPAYDVSDTDDVGLPIKVRFNLGPALQPIAGSMPVNRLRR